MSMESSSSQHVECPRLRDFDFGNLLGQGAFARVLHVRDTRTREEYALKVLNKRQTQVRDRKSSVIAERNLLMSLDHPGIVRLHWTLQDDWSLYFVLEFVEGGELASQIARMGASSLEFAQFYAAEIVVILEYLQARRVAHRDLKPENLMLTLTGHLKLIDFDAAIVVPDEGEGDAAGGCCQGQPACAGTSLYLPPEVIQSTAKLREAFALDLWALGCIIFQMLVGKTPFAAHLECLVFEKILQGDYMFPRGFPHKSACELVDALLSPEPSARPGQGAEGMADLKRRSFFGGSTAAFNELLCRRPPHRAHRRRRGRDPSAMLGRSIASCSDSSASTTRSYDFASSGEGTPEIGQNFLAQMSKQINVLDAHARECDARGLEVEPDLDHVAPHHPESSDFAVNWEASPQFTISIQHSCPASSSRGPSRASSRRSTPRQLSGTSSPPLSHKGSTLEESPLLAKQPATRPEATQDATLAQSSANRCWIRPDMPLPSWKQWLEDLTARQMLHCDEGVIICGSVVRRTFSCLRPKVLMLTDKPRLLLLDSSGLRLLRQIELAGTVSEDGVVVSSWSPFDFELRTPQRKYTCYDINVGAEEWARKINSACERASGKH